MAYNKKTDYWKWKANQLISNFQTRHKKNKKEYTYHRKRADYAEVLKTKMTRCEYCDTKLNKSNFSVDHMVPLSKGGDTNDKNLAYCCKTCNSSKGEMSDVEFIQLRKLTKKWEDHGDYLFRRLRAASLVFRRRRF
jgi:5-methylcytosine-specific restriction endonuclease McrA